jgi:hypothetical protein
VPSFYAFRPKDKGGLTLTRLLSYFVFPQRADHLFALAVLMTGNHQEVSGLRGDTFPLSQRYVDAAVSRGEGRFQAEGSFLYIDRDGAFLTQIREGRTLPAGVRGTPARHPRDRAESGPSVTVALSVTVLPIRRTPDNPKRGSLGLCCAS